MNCQGATVGTVYDRAFLAYAGKVRAVTDRAYSAGDTLLPLAAESVRSKTGQCEGDKADDDDVKEQCPSNQPGPACHIDDGLADERATGHCGMREQDVAQAVYRIRERIHGHKCFHP